MHECYEICAQMSTCGWLINIKLDSVFFNISLPYFSFFNQFSYFSQIITVIFLSIISCLILPGLCSALGDEQQLAYSCGWKDMDCLK